MAYELFRVHDVNVSSHGDPAIDESLFFGASGIVMAPYGDYWKFIKKLLVMKVLGPLALDRFRSTRADELERFYANLLDKDDHGEELFRGEWPLEKFGISLFKKELMSLSSRFDELLERILVEHEEKLDYHDGTSMDMMDVLLAAYRDENAEYKITRHHIKSLFVDLILGGTDTSAQEIEWTMAEIVNNPKILDKLRGEIDSVVGKTRLIQETDLPNLPYLQAVVKEGLRLHPQAPIMLRAISEGCSVGGFYIPNNTTLVNSYAVMRDPDSWEDPEEFKPERFLASSRKEEEEINEKTLKYLPFGSGRKGCPGVNLGYIFVGTAIGVMVQCFDWRVNGDKVYMEEAVAGMTLNMAYPLKSYEIFKTQDVNISFRGPQALERSRGVRADELERFYMSLVDKAMKNESVDIGKEAMKLTNNSICKMIMGRSCSEENGEAERVRDLVTESTALTMKIFLANMFYKPFKKLRISLFKKEIMSVSCRFDEVLEKIFEQHEKKPDEDQDTNLMDGLLAAYRDENAEFKFTRNHIKSLFVDLLVAGSDTSRHGTQWTMAEIINHPSVLERLKEEIDYVVGKTRLVQETDIPNLPYLQATVKEGLRLHPPGALFARTSGEECRIRGFYVPENTPLVVNAFAVMRDPNCWEDPNEFKPERFLASSGSGKEDEKEKALKYIPFGAGRRRCPGVNLAYIFVGTAIGVMVQCFDWKIEGDKVNMEEAPRALVLTMAHPLKCIPVSRTLKPFNFESTNS
ncbi:hypothetical protein AALP_AA3G300300 [Arabis alpina]|uniref:Cytochrome p450 n=1 Tax=Arabis alpina TaxID=50452 RepID=A0A087HCM6_ARAAL|nr:hypothetical protein AALP_AA3G300300 [Arabis alpina]